MDMKKRSANFTEYEKCLLIKLIVLEILKGLRNSISVNDAGENLSFENLDNFLLGCGRTK
jgi:hypothetical protein